MHAASHAVCFERPGEPGWGTVLSTGVYGCTWFSFGFTVSFGVLPLSMDCTLIFQLPCEDGHQVGLCTTNTHFYYSY